MRLSVATTAEPGDEPGNSVAQHAPTYARGHRCRLLLRSSGVGETVCVGLEHPWVHAWVVGRPESETAYG